MVLASVDEGGILYAHTLDIADDDGLPFSGSTDSEVFFDQYTYQWIRVDGNNETNIGADSPRYSLVDADIGKLIKVRVSFMDDADNAESLTSLPFGPVTEPAPLPSPTTLVGNTGQSGSATANITQQYAMEFELGSHGQGYEISGVSIDLAAAPSSLTVSLWIGDHSNRGSSPRAKLFDFENPASFQVGLNEFTAPAGALAYHNVHYYIVLSGFGTTLSIKETTSDAEDAGGEPGATLGNNALVRALSDTGRWASPVTTRSNVLRLAVKGSRQLLGILFSNYAQPATAAGDQEIISVGDNCCFSMAVGDADRYLIRGFSWNADNATSVYGGFGNPYELHEGTGSSLGASTRRFTMFNTRNSAGIPAFTAPQGATVEGGKTYTFLLDLDLGTDGEGNTIERIDAILTRAFGPKADGADLPSVAGFDLSAYGDAAFPDAPFAAIIGIPLHAVVQNLGQTDNGNVAVGGANAKVLSQAFGTGSDGYVLTGIGVNIEGSNGRIPDGQTFVSVSVHADSSGKPGAKLFDLVSPTEYAAGHSFFEAPRGAILEPNTSYVLVWRHNSGTSHRLVKTTGNSEDSDALAGSSIANAFHLGADLDNLSEDAGGNALEIAVYRSTSSPNATGRPVILPTAEDHGVLAVDTSSISDPDGIPNVGKLDSTGVLRDFSYRWIRVDGGTETVVGADSVDYRQIDSEFEPAGIRIESGRYRLVEADVGKLLKVEVSFFDVFGTFESQTSLPFRPVPEPPRPLPESTLVSNTGQSPSATATITADRYEMGFKLGSPRPGLRDLQRVDRSGRRAVQSDRVAMDGPRSWVGRRRCANQAVRL